VARGYRSAAVCRRGHVVSANLENRQVRTRGADVPPFCTKCGAAVLTKCEKCGSEIPGHAIGVTTARWAPPRFCLECSTPFPWLDRAGRIYLLENMLDNEEVDEATRLEVREELQALAATDLPAEEQERRWAKVKSMAPGLWQSSQQILVSIVTAEAKTRLGLPPG
jgi:hypothetical protein